MAALDRPPLAVNRSMPENIVIPVLAYPNVRDAVEWLCGAFGFTERLRIADHRAQLSFGAGAIVVAGSGGSSSAPANAGALVATHSVMVRVADVNAHYEHSTTFGAKALGPPTDFPYGERQYTVQDLGGHVWTFSQSIADVDPQTWGGILLPHA
jgi:uncharacterized glyoxalase superfamily protein PhnB